ncbi:hypothetical protein OG955_05850 [Streptomyces sp. NBC_01602]|nr:hypothetical protein OG955_05850 [Streptomyces sp. NBC_01602]
MASLDLAEGDRAAFAARAQDVLTRTVNLNLTDIWLTPGWLGIMDEAVRRAWLDAAREERCVAAHAAYLQDQISPPADGTTTHPSPPAQSVLRITTLCGFAVDRGGVTLTAESFGRRKAIEILLLLCASERHSQSRAELHDKLWPELSREKASVRFRVALHALHHVLEPDRAPREPTRFVRTSADRIWLDPHSVTIDADEFRAHADQLLASAECDPTEGQKARRRWAPTNSPSSTTIRPSSGRFPYATSWRSASPNSPWRPRSCCWKQATTLRPLPSAAASSPMTRSSNRPTKSWRRPASPQATRRALTGHFVSASDSSRKSWTSGPRGL